MRRTTERSARKPSSSLSRTRRWCSAVRRRAGRDPFLWGVATAAHQIDGNNINSDYWLPEHLASTGFPEPSGDACDSWERWHEDVALVKGMGLNAYRFSVEWARVEPEPSLGDAPQRAVRTQSSERLLERRSDIAAGRDRERVPHARSDNTHDSAGRTPGALESDTEQRGLVEGCVAVSRLDPAKELGHIAGALNKSLMLTLMGPVQAALLAGEYNQNGVVDAGGLFNYARQTGMMPAQP